jgi:hypothetical protein
MRTFDVFWHLDTRDLHSVNEAMLVLLPKSMEAITIKDYHPISLIHTMGKLVSKVLANRLATHISELVHPSQSAFIAGRIIQDCFKVVQASARLLHARRKPSLLLKIDIARAFNSVAWPFVLDILRHLGFPGYWTNWISTILMSASTRPLLNGTPGQRICHARGLHQGDALSPLLFVLVVEVLDALFRKAGDCHLLQSLGLRTLPHRASLYADDLVLLLYPRQQDLLLLRQVVEIFEGASSLGCNLSKCQMAAIRWDEDQRQLAASMPASAVPYQLPGRSSLHGQAT